MLLVSMLFGGFAWRLKQAKRQAEAIAKLREHACSVRYDYELAAEEKDLKRPWKSPWPAVLVDRLGVDFFHEVHSVFGRDGVLSGRDPIAADVPSLPLCENVLREAMRLYPPAYVVGRTAKEDCTIGDYFIRQGTNVLMSSWVVHRDWRWYDRPDEFQPDRWADGLLARIPKYAYFPFGGGPRACIGNNFAMLEGVLVIATMVQQLQLSAVTQPPIKLLPVVTLKPGQPLEMKVQKR